MCPFGSGFSKVPTLQDHIAATFDIQDILKTSFNRNRNEIYSRDTLLLLKSIV